MSDEKVQFDFTKRMGKKRQAQFAKYLMELQARIDFKISARGWCYYLESERIINKDQFDKVEQAINRCRKNGLLPIDFVTDESARMFHGVEQPDFCEVEDYVERYLNSVENGWQMFTPDWWENEDYYIQVIVEKIDLMTLFTPVCEKYKIPIATSKGWSSIIQRGRYASRFQEAEENGLKCVLLYCGDYDPDGWRISDFLRSNLNDLKNITWNDGSGGYDPENLIIERFGLNAEFIKKHNLTWIDNLITGSGGYIAYQGKDGIIRQGKSASGRPHPNFELKYAQDYLSKNGVRKCEGNAIIPYPKAARGLIEEAIWSFLGDDAENRMKKKVIEAQIRYKRFLNKSGIKEKIKEAKQLFIENR